MWATYGLCVAEKAYYDQYQVKWLHCEPKSDSNLVLEILGRRRDRVVLLYHYMPSKSFGDP